MNDPNSKISPFKIMDGVQPVDQENKYLLVPHLFPTSKDDKTAYWKHRDWQKAFATGNGSRGHPLQRKGEMGSPPACTGEWSTR